MNCEFCDKELNDTDCTNPLCQLQLQIKLLELKRDELRQDVKSNESLLKQLNNIHRLMGITPKGLELMINVSGIDVPGMKISANPEWTWDKISIENAVTIGLHFLGGIEKTAKEWADFVHAKGVKIQIKKDTVKTAEKIKKAEKLRSGADNSTKPVKTTNKLTAFEKLIAQRMKTFGWSQAEAIESIKVMGGKIEECRDLSTLLQFVPESQNETNT